MTDATDLTPSTARDPNSLLDLMPFTKAIGAVFSRYLKDEVTARLDWAPELCTAGVGRTVIVVETDVRDPQDRLVARVLQTQLVLSA